MTSDEEDDGGDDGDEEEEDGDGGDDEVAPMKKPKHKSAEKRKAPDASGDANAKPAPPPVKALKLERRIASPSPSPTPGNSRPESAKRPRVSEIGVVPGDVFFDSSDDDVEPPALPTSGDEGKAAPVAKRSPSRPEPAPAKKPARTVRPGGVLWSDSDED